MGLVLMADRKGKLIILLLAFAFGSCAPLQPPNATGPRGNEPLYPILLPEDSHRKEATLLVFSKLSQQAGNVKTSEPQLQPVTATIKSLPADSGRPLYLPKVGAAAVMNEEETRESLRRFVNDWHELIGADPAKLSLVERLDQADGTKLANYEQRPFRYPIRGAYGKLQISFQTDRRILNISSTCIPDADRMQTALAAITVKLKAEDAIKQLRENDISYTDAKGTRLNFRLPAANQMNPLGLVTYILPPKDRADDLEFHLAWEIEIGNAPVKLAYVDAVNGQLLAAE